LILAFIPMLKLKVRSRIRSAENSARQVEGSGRHGLRLVDVLVVFEPVDLVVVLSGGHQKSQQEVAVRDWFACSFRAQDNIERVLLCLDQLAH
jgi:hypothetical protein